MSAVSPAVLVPSLFRMKRLGYGEIKGINTLLIAASSLDDIVSISAFGILLGVLFSSGAYILYTDLTLMTTVETYVHIIIRIKNPSQRLKSNKRKLNGPKNGNRITPTSLLRSLNNRRKGYRNSDSPVGNG